MEVEETTPERYDIPGVYYAQAEEVTGAADAPLTAKAGSIYVGSGSSFTFSSGAVRSHSATYGGAIYVANGGTFTMTGGVIAYNQAKWGGAIYVEAGGTCRLLGGTITGNASEEATAVYVEDGGTLVVDGCNIVNNYTQLYGNYIDFYVDGNPISVSIGNSTTFDLADAPLDYEHCPGYFTDENCSVGVEDGASLGTVIQSAVATGEPGEIYNLYTKSATLDKLTFTLSGDAYSVAGNGTPTGVVVIPRQYDGKNVTSIGEGAFSGCSGLTSVVIPDSVTSISNAAFSGCSGLTSVVIPDSVTSISNAAFSGCSGLTQFIVDGNNTIYASQDGILYNKAKTEIVAVPQGITGSITLPDSVTSIGMNAFSGCSGLTSITIGSGVTSIGSGAFSGCSGLTSVTIGSSVTSIGYSAFSGCSGLLEVCNLSNLNITAGSYDNGYVAYCAYLVTNDPEELGGQQVQSNNVNYYVSAKGTYKTAIGLVDTTVTSVVLDNDCTAIKSSAFSNNTTLTDVTIGSNVTSIGSSAFYGCSGLTSVVIPDSVTSISNAAFSGCSGLTQFIVDGNNTIYASQDGILYNKAKTEIVAVPQGITGSITLPDTLTSIGGYAFRSCSGLTSVTIGSNVTSIGEGAFSGCSGLTSITIPANVTSIGSSAFQSCSGLTSVNYGGDIEGWLGITFGSKWEGSSWTLYINNSAVTDLVIPSTVTTIPAYAFYGCSGLTSVTIPSSVTSIGSSAFYGCTSLTEINYNANISTAFTSSSNIFYQAGQSGNGITLNIGDNVTTIPAYLFSGSNEANAPKLTSVNFGSGLQSIGNYAFRYCTGLTSLEFPSTLTSIGRNAFTYCTGLTKVYIPSSVTTITAGSASAAPFYNCSTSLNIYCEAASKPSGWGTHWNKRTSSATFTTTWSYSRENFEAL